MESCQRKACTGKIVDGSCDECGLPPIGVKLLTQEEVALHTQTQNSSTQATIKTGTSKTTDTFATSVTGQTRGTSTSSRRHTSRSTRSSTARRQSLGGGLVSLQSMPSLDPLTLLMANPEVPERKRRCPHCDAKVSRTKGFCGQCGHEYNFEPSLKAGDVIHTKYEIKGPIAFGGLGWIYLGWDTVLNRWVIMKGLLNAKDAGAAAAAMVERQFLAAVKHAKIVAIYDFVNHGHEGYIIMEYVGGKAVGSLQKEKGVFPVEEAIAYILGILPAFSYLHSKGLVYCDFKPENFMLEGDDVKLIDMGGVRRIGDPDGDIYGTRGFMAPEASDDPVEVSDLYTVGRALATMIMDFKYAREYENSLPTPEEQAVLRDNEALYRFLLRATHQDPDQRFQSADEMADQLHGVLREIVALKSGPKPAESKVFTSDNLFDADDVDATRHVDVALLPTLKMDANDAAANDLLALSAIRDPGKRISALERLLQKFANQSVEVRLRLADALLLAGRANDARKLLDAVFAEDPYDWRVAWYRGKSFLAENDGAKARIEFGKAYFEMPGELAPKLAIAFAAEVAGNFDEATRFYQRVAKVDPSQTTACFGLARCALLQSNAQAASEAYALVPAQHSLFSLSRILLAQLLLHSDKNLRKERLEHAAQTISMISTEGGMIHQLSAKLYSQALALIANGAAKEDAQQSLLGEAFVSQTLRKAAERQCREAARFASSREEKIDWIDRANAIRPQTLF